MTYQNFIWKNRTINGRKIKAVKVKVYQVPHYRKITIEKFRRLYTDGKIENGKAQKYSFFVDVNDDKLLFSKKTIENDKFDEKENETFIIVKIYINSRYNNKKLTMLYDQMKKAGEEELYQYIENAMKQSEEIKKLGK